MQRAETWGEHPEIEFGCYYRLLCLLPAARCLLPAACCLLPAARCLLPAPS
jgi:hypothetical protein